MPHARPPPRYQPSDRGLLVLVLASVFGLTRKVNFIMATVQELQAKISALSTAIDTERAEVLAALSTLKTEIQALKDQIAAGTPATQQDLDDLGATLDPLITKTQAIIDQSDVG